MSLSTKYPGWIRVKTVGIVIKNIKVGEIGKRLHINKRKNLLSNFKVIKLIEARKSRMNSSTINIANRTNRFRNIEVSSTDLR